MPSKRHFNNRMHTLLRHDLDTHTKVISVDEWVKGVLRVSLEELTKWSNAFSDDQLFLDEIVLASMALYGQKAKEEHGYSPWSAIINRIIEVAHTYIQDLSTFPLTDIVFTPGNLNPIEGVGPQEGPDVVVTLQSALRQISHSKQVEGTTAARDCTWNDIICCVNFNPREVTKPYAEWVKGVVSAGGQLPGIQEGLRDPNYEVSFQCCHLYLFNILTITPAQVRGPPPGIRKASIAYASQPLTAEPSSQDCWSRKRGALEEPESAPVGKRQRIGYTQEEDLDDQPSDDASSNVATQAAGYALELLTTSSGARNHCIQLVVDGSDIQFWYYDAGGIIYSDRMCWMSEFHKFAAIIVAFALLDLPGWGIGGVPNFVPPASPLPDSPLLPTSLTGYSLMMPCPTEQDGEKPRDVRVILGNEVFTQRNLVGRRTVVYEVTTEPTISDKPLVLKMSMQPCDRVPEHELLIDAAEKGVGHIPKVHLWMNKESVWRLSDGVWGRVFDKNEDGKAYKNCCQRLVVFTKYEPVEHIVSAANMHSIFSQLIQCE